MQGDWRMTQRNQSELSEPTILGDEELDERAMESLHSMLRHRPGEEIVALSGFDFQTKVIAVTNRSVIITGDEEGLIEDIPYERIDYVRREGRTLILRSRNRDKEYRMGRDDVVEALAELIGDLQANRPGDRKAAPRESRMRQNRSAGSSGQETGIAERVKFWEEQDRINQELIPRVIRQNELLAKHIGDHENLPHVAAAAARTAALRVKEEIEEGIELIAASQTAMAEELRKSEAQVAETRRELDQSVERQVAMAEELRRHEAQAEEMRHELDRSVARQTEMEEELQKSTAQSEELRRKIDESKSETARIEGDLQETKTAHARLERDFRERKESTRSAKLMAAAAGITAIAAIAMAVAL